METAENLGLDALGLLAARSGTDVRFGDVDVSGSVRGLTASSVLNDLPTAKLQLDPHLLGGRPPDYFAIADLARIARGHRHHLFTGSVLTAEPHQRSVELALGSMPEMRDRLVGPLVTWMISAPELVHAMARSAGLQESQLNIHGLDSLPVELFEVIASVRSLDISERGRIDNVHLLPVDAVQPALERLRVEPEFASRFNEAACHAVTFVVAQRTFDAEQEALQRIDIALAWLAAQSRYGSALWPDGTPRPYARTASRAVPNRGTLVWVRGLMSTRQWIRATQPVAQGTSLALDSGPSSWVGQLRLLTAQERQAALALRRAGAAEEEVDAITALWESLEFYMAGVAVPESFSREQLRMLRKTVTIELPPKLRGRVLNALNRLNEAPLLARLRVATEEDGVMLSDGEWELLSRLRRVRNEAVHGAAPSDVSRGEIGYGVSIAARLLLHRATRRRLDFEKPHHGG